MWPAQAGAQRVNIESLPTSFNPDKSVSPLQGMAAHVVDSMFLNYVVQLAKVRATLRPRRRHGKRLDQPDQFRDITQVGDLGG